MADSQPEQDDEVKLEMLRRAAAEGFADIERGDFELITTLDELDQFMERVAAKARKRVER